MKATHVSTKYPSPDEMLCSYLSAVSHGIYKLGRKTTIPKAQEDAAYGQS